MLNLFSMAAIAAMAIIFADTAFASAPSEAALVQRVNYEVNSALEYRADDLTKWASPAEALDRGYGACAEFALTKWVKAVRAGVPEAKLRLAYGKVGGVAHMVLIYQDQADPLVLDNLQAPKRLSERKDLQVVFTFDRAKLYAGDKVYPATRYGQWARWLKKNARELAPAA